jgi:Mn-containing catalase
MIIVPDDDLKQLEKLFGPGVRRMGSWNSDGIFSYASVPIVAVEQAAESLNDPMVAKAVFRLKQAPERTKLFIELIQSFGPVLIEQIVAAYRQRSHLGLFHRETAA